ncbi:RNase_Zc3h12a domain-containing protein/PPR_3 domain-containing protein [Cephalotus follicularis]|uniref:ribonuclease P n=1 Tax=Cephalotus follicularis TaxID=3775 RepID=A0A1Q3CE79_CEPFO|nr:RNase_Zc3h12a domain-containing protein/PPR_3 domain-containing protein [Cephalotus follicularis]
MASLTLNTLQQNNLFSVTYCKYPLSLNTFKFHYLTEFFTSLPPKHTLKPKSSPIYVHSNIHAILPTTKDHESSTETKNSRARRETGSGCSSLRSKDKRVDRNSVEILFSSCVADKTDRRFTKDKYTRKSPGREKRREIGNVNSSMPSKDNNIATKSLKDMGNLAVNEKVDKGTNMRGGNMNNHVIEEKMGKRSKKKKDDSLQDQWRVELDMCSKIGDVIGALRLYDTAQREGTELGQYHYTVLLYLCSSAAVGVVRPAKSGSGGRTMNALSMANGVSSVNFMQLGVLRDKVEESSGAKILNCPISSNGQLVDTSRSSEKVDKLELNSIKQSDDLDLTFNRREDLTERSSRYSVINGGNGGQEDQEIRVSEDFKKYALERGFEIYRKMCLDKVPMNEATLTAVARMAMSMGNGDLAFDMVKKMKSLGINPRLRSYGPALSAFCNSGDVNKAFAVEKHMLEHGVYPEEPELEALLRVSVGAGRGDKVYHLLHKLRRSVRKVSPSTADIIVEWFHSKAASEVGNTIWDSRLIKEAIENGGGGWHGQGWLGKGKWTVSHSVVGSEALCQCCGEKLDIIDLESTETENFAESVASIAIKREKNSSFQKFQKWLDYYGPFEAVVDAANVGLFSQKRFMPSKVNAIVNGIRQKLPSKKWPLIVLHNRRITGQKMDQPVNKALIEKWKNADALYATPTGSNDDWYWLYAAIKFKCLIVTNDEMRDHIFQLLGNDFFPKWKERHQVHFSFTDAGPIFHMPPACSIVIQESENGHWHIPIESEQDYHIKRTWLCITRANSREARKDSTNKPEGSTTQPEAKIKSQPLNCSNHENTPNPCQETYKSLRDTLSESAFSDHCSIVSEIEAAEKLGNCVIDFQI